MTCTTSAKLLMLLATVPAWCAGPTLTPQQIQAAMQEGTRWFALPVQFGKGKAVGDFFDEELKKKGKRVRLAGLMAMDGISKHVTFFNDWEAVAAQVVAANQQMRGFKAEEAQTAGLLHAYVDVHALGLIPSSKLVERYGAQQVHLVLLIEGQVIQPVSKTAFSGYLEFAYDLSPGDLRNPVTVILIDGDGMRHQQKANLAGVLDYK